MNFKSKINKKRICFILISLFHLIFFSINKAYASEDWSKFNTWEEKANTNKYAFGASAVSVGNKIYSFGGYTLGESTPRFEIYDSIADTWTVQPDMPYGARYHGCVEINGNIYVFGGQKTDIAYTNEMYCYNIEKQTWSTKASMLEAKRSFAHCVINGKIYVAGGYGANGFLNTLDCYDPKTNTWTRLANAPTKRSSHAGTSSNGKFYVMGGWNNESSGEVNKYLTTVEVYNPDTNSWTKKEDIPLGRTTLEVEEHEGYIYAIGGRNENEDAVGTLDCYSVYADKWIELSPMPTARYNHTVVRIDNKLYASNGSVGSTPYKTTEVYTIPNQAYLAFAFANKYKTVSDIEMARMQLNRLENSNIKLELQELLNNIEPIDMPIMSYEETTASADIYIVPLNKLAITIDTNNISFEDFDATESMEKRSAFNIEVESTLPYSLEVSMPTDITNKDSTSIVDKDLISIKESSSNTYQTFNNATDYLLLADNQRPGTVNNHSIDIRLNPKVLPETSSYKAVLKFKIQQK